VPVDFSYYAHSAVRTIKAAGWPGRRADIPASTATNWKDDPTCDDFVRALISAQRRFAFKIAPTGSFHAAPIEGAREAIEPFLCECPAR
jgi:hypothetical protein